MVENSEKKITEELIENIFKFKKERCPDFSTLDAIIEYCHFNDLNIQEIGNVISEHKEFVDILEKQLIREKYIRTPKNQTSDLVEEEW